jgi:hypothetical protein
MIRWLLFIEGVGVLLVMTLVANAVGHALIHSSDPPSQLVGFLIYVGLGVVWTSVVMRWWRRE